MIVKLEAVNALAQLIAAIGVIVSLFYLAAQIRQNTRSTRAVVVDSLAHSLVTLLAQHTQNRELLRALSVVIENWETASQDDREITLPFIFATFKLFENVWFQQRQGTLDRQQWEGWDVNLLSSAWREDVVVDAKDGIRARFSELSRSQ